MLNIHFTRVSDLAAPDHIIINRPVPISGYRDGFGNWCSRIVAAAGRVRISADAIVYDTKLSHPSAPGAHQVPVEQLPEETLVFLLPSRFCDSDRLLDLAWRLFAHATPGWGRVQAICDWVHRRIAFGYEHARVTRTASEAYQESRGVCRDYAHLAVAFCRALNIPARYCTGYLGDVAHHPRIRPATSRPGSRPLWEAAGHFRPAEQCSTRRESLDRAGAGCSGRGNHNDVRPQYARGLSGMDG